MFGRQSRNTGSPIFSRRLSARFAERAVELGNGLKSDGGGNFTDSHVVVGEQMPRSLDAVIDVVMPYLGGLATIRALHKMNPSLKFIQISGGMDAVESADAVQSSANAFLQKPFSPEQLLEAVHEVLREPDSDAG